MSNIRKIILIDLYPNRNLEILILKYPPPPKSYLINTKELSNEIRINQFLQTHI